MTSLDKINEAIRQRTIKFLIDLSASMRRELFELLLERDIMLEKESQKKTEKPDREREGESIEPLKYQLREWRKLIKHLPPTGCDRDDVAEIEKLVLLGIASQPTDTPHAEKEALYQCVIEAAPKIFREAIWGKP